MNKHARTTSPATTIALATLALALVAPGADLFAFPRYNDVDGGDEGCSNCHGAFTDGTSPKGTVFLGDNKHEMHRSNGLMATDCDLCHSSGDGDNPFTNSSNGTASNPGLGCAGCHMPQGLRLHHANNNVNICADCHDLDPAPPENTSPPYFGTADTNATNPCNDTDTQFAEENWSGFDLVGLDNDGDKLYDAADPDCSGPAQTPGEVSDPAVQPMLVAAHNRVLGQLALSYSPACASDDNNVEHGPLSQVAVYGYNGQTCAVGNTGSAIWPYPGGSTFFVMVGQSGANEGSYGVDSSGAERPESAGVACGTLGQDLANRCD